MTFHYIHYIFHLLQHHLHYHFDDNIVYTMTEVKEFTNIAESIFGIKQAFDASLDAQEFISYWC